MMPTSPGRAPRGHCALSRLQGIKVRLAKALSQSKLPGLLLLASLLAGGGAAAQNTRKCSLPAALTGRTCPEAECIVLSDAVHAPDACGGVVSCEPLVGCSVLRQMRQRWLTCYTRRITVNARCWSNFDLGHQEAAAQAITHVGRCDAKIALPEPVGCADCQ